MILPPKLKATEFIAIIEHTLKAFKGASPELNPKYLGRTFHVPWSAVDECIDPVLPARSTESRERRRSLLLHFMEHFREMIL